MINQKMILAIVAGFVTMFVLAGLFHLVLMKEYFIAKAGNMSSISYALLSYGILSILMSYMYPMMSRTGSVIRDGLIFGILIGLICRVPWEVLELGYGRGDWGFVITEGVWHSIEEGVAGIVIAMIYARGGTAS
jgi:hypothetical protein